MKAATVALACSGTVTTELALAGCPMVVGYRLGPVTYALLKRLIRTPLHHPVQHRRPGLRGARADPGRRAPGRSWPHEVALRLDDPALRARQVAGAVRGARQDGPRRSAIPPKPPAEAVLKVVAERRA